MWFHSWYRGSVLLVVEGGGGGGGERKLTEVHISHDETIYFSSEGRDGEVVSKLSDGGVLH